MIRAQDLKGVIAMMPAFTTREWGLSGCGGYGRHKDFNGIRRQNDQGWRQRHRHHG